ncbi:MAG: sulfurtransferase [Planctomycetota bacterium]|nr:sulfurtransferase [Planctomycetota bacterium]
MICFPFVSRFYVLLILAASLIPNTVQAEQWGSLVTADQLAQTVDSKVPCRILDLGPKKSAYLEGHIPGSVYVDWIRDITALTKSERYNLPPRKQFEELMSRCGITPKTHIFLYDDLDNRISVRMFWTLRYFGHPHIHILDGGKRAWQKGGHPLQRNVIRIPPTDYRCPGENRSLTASADFIFSNLNQSGLWLIDGRPLKQYTGEDAGKVYHTGKPHSKRGHIPGARHLFWKDNLEADGTFKSKEELKRMYAKFLQQQNREIVTYCNEGLHAAVPWFVLSELLDRKNVKVYDDSMCEWANSNRPTERAK